MAHSTKRQKLSNGAAVAVEAAEDTVPLATIDEKSEAAAQQRRSLFVRSLPASTTSESLTQLFSESYPIKHATAVIDKETKQCRGFGFVTFADAEDAQRAKQELNGHVLDGRKIRIEIAEPRQRETGKADAELSLKGVKIKARTEREAPQQRSRLIVRNLPWTIKKSEQLAKLFLSYGKVKAAYIPNKAPGLLAGFGFVVMRGMKNAEKAMEAVNGKEVDGRTLAVDWAVNKETYQGLLTGQDEVGGESAEKENTDEIASVNGQDDGEELEGSSDYDETALDDDLEGEEGSDDDEGQDGDVDGDDDNESTSPIRRSEDGSNTLFVRNLPFMCADEDLEDHFTRFGSVRYARVVMDHETGRSKGTGFVCFYKKDDADTCVREAPRNLVQSQMQKGKEKPAAHLNSILQNESTDPTGQYTLDGRVLQVSSAVAKSEATRLNIEGAAHRSKRDKDKRRLYLLSEGTISSNSKLWESLPPSEKTMREASAKQRKSLVESNPSLHLSLTRLSIRNIPRSVDSKELKALAREAVVGFATDVKAGKRQRLSKEELARGGEEMVAAEISRKKAGKGLVKQAKVVFESAGGSKVHEDSGAGRSRGYGFIEYYTHRSALMGLRWLNGHAIGYQVQESGKAKHRMDKEQMQDRKKRLIVEFAIENAQVVLRRNGRESKARERSKAVSEGRAEPTDATKSLKADRYKVKAIKANPGGRPEALRKRKRGPDDGNRRNGRPAGDAEKKAPDEKLAKRNQIIGRKRAIRKARKGGK